MATVIRGIWPLLLGVLLLMVGNGMQGTLLGIRGGIEGISAFQMSVVMASYYAGFLAGSLIVPDVIKSVGHVRVFAALGSAISAVLIFYAVAPNWLAWSVMRVLIGFCFCGVYITAESWLNAAANNQTRGQSLAAYMIVQMLGIVIAQALLNLADPAAFTLFAISSILVSLAFTPILLSAQPAPQFLTIKRMSFGKLYRASPLGCVGIFLMGGVFAALSGMSSVWGTEMGLSVGQIASFVAAIYIGGMVLQYPIGWLSDRFDRRKLVLSLTAAGALVTLATILLPMNIWGFTLVGALLGGVANPVYTLLLAYTNDYLDQEDMASASAGLLFIYGLGSMAGPIITGWLMEVMGPDGYWAYMGVLMAALAGYARWRMTRRAALGPSQQGSFPVVSPGATRFAVEAMEEAQTDADDPATVRASDAATAEGDAERLSGEEQASSGVDPAALSSDERKSD
ncbi:MFS transporter [Paracoccus sp. TK19116]|uniref:MFS transporter n=1 Tax=Paracoccus albicereus TaxID=2922394 RepID=A0ABT1MNB2_9RHOB|nr:MFS transporter [Paracoccus albicereus]MCQ0969778.1 MFS transporter [Paracoccus albicereus]